MILFIIEVYIIDFFSLAWGVNENELLFVRRDTQQKGKD